MVRRHVRSFPAYLLGFLLAWQVSSGCDAQPELPSALATQGEAELETISQEAALTSCPGGPAFPSCYGTCGALACSPIDPGACCHCDPGCLDRGDCCCDFLDYCPAPPPPSSCEGECGGQAPGGCWCDTSCTSYDDCCDDYLDVCPPAAPSSCEGHCGGQSPDGCWCDAACTSHDDCCDDYGDVCVPACNGSVPPSGVDERVAAIAVGPSGELYVAGTRFIISQPMDERDGFLRRLHPTTFATLWDVPIDNCFWDSVEDVAVTPDGDVVVVGSMRSGPFASTPATFFVRRYSPAGVMRWHFEPSSMVESTGTGVAVDPGDGSVLVTGWVTGSSSAPLLARVRGDGTPAFVRSVPLVAGTHGGKAVSVDADSRIAMVATSYGATPYTVVVARLDAVGDVLWTQTQAMPSAIENEAVDVALGGAGEVYALSVARVAGNVRWPFLGRYSASGAVVWTQAVDPGAGTLIPAALMRSASGSLVLAGHGMSPLGVPYRPWHASFTAAGVQSDFQILSSPTGVTVLDAALGLTGAAAYLAAQQPGAYGQSTVIVTAPL